MPPSADIFGFKGMDETGHFGLIWLCVGSIAWEMWLCIGARFLTWGLGSGIIFRNERRDQRDIG